AKLEGDATEYERQQHDQNWEVNRRDDDREGEWKGSEQAEPSEYQPGFVAVPHWRDRIHGGRALGFISQEAVKHSDAEVETVEHHVIEHRKSKEDGPQRYEIEHHRVPRHNGGTARAALSNGWCGRPPSISITSSSSSDCCGPRRTRPAIKAMPVGNMIR